MKNESPVCTMCYGSGEITMMGQSDADNHYVGCPACIEKDLQEEIDRLHVELDEYLDEIMDTSAVIYAIKTALTVNGSVESALNIINEFEKGIYE